MRPYLDKPFTKIGLMEWLKVKALSSSPSTGEKQTNKQTSTTKNSMYCGALFLNALRIRTLDDGLGCHAVSLVPF
jgi:hypothetical protein